MKGKKKVHCIIQKNMEGLTNQESSRALGVSVEDSVGQISLIFLPLPNPASSMRHIADDIINSSSLCKHGG